MTGCFAGLGTGFRPVYMPTCLSADLSTCLPVYPTMVSHPTTSKIMHMSCRPAYLSTCPPLAQSNSNFNLRFGLLCVDRIEYLYITARVLDWWIKVFYSVLTIHSLKWTILAYFYLPTCLPANLSTFQPVYLPACQPIGLSTIDTVSP